MSVCAHVCVYGCVPLHACVQRPEEAVASLKLQLQVLMELIMRMLGSELWSS